MYLIKKYNDGSFLPGYESGDEIILSEDIVHYDLWGHEYARDKKGTKATITEVIKDNSRYCSQFPFIWIRTENGRLAKELSSAIVDKSKIDCESLEKV